MQNISINYFKRDSWLNWRFRIFGIIRTFSIEKLSKLNHLSLSNNNFQKIPGSIGNIKSLEILAIEKDLIPDIPKLISKLKNLKKIFGTKGICYLDNTKPQRQPQRR